MLRKAGPLARYLRKRRQRHSYARDLLKSRVERDYRVVFGEEPYSDLEKMMRAILAKSYFCFQGDWRTFEKSLETNPCLGLKLLDFWSLFHADERLVGRYLRLRPWFLRNVLWMRDFEIGGEIIGEEFPEKLAEELREIESRHGLKGRWLKMNVKFYTGITVRRAGREPGGKGVMA